MAVIIRAQAQADSEIIRAEGALQGAALLETSSVAVELAKIEKVGSSLGAGTSFYFGASQNAFSDSVISRATAGK